MSNIPDDRYHGLKVGDAVYLDPRRLPDIVIITKEEAEKLSNKFIKRTFVITEVK